MLAYPAAARRCMDSINQGARSFDKASENLGRDAQVRISGEWLR
jgi:hypothetical protein